jgi:hypothetical protein
MCASLTRFELGCTLWYLSTGAPSPEPYIAMQSQKKKTERKKRKKEKKKKKKKKRNTETPPTLCLGNCTLCWSSPCASVLKHLDVRSSTTGSSLAASYIY